MRGVLGWVGAAVVVLLVVLAAAGGIRAWADALTAEAQVRQVEARAKRDEAAAVLERARGEVQAERDVAAAMLERARGETAVLSELARGERLIFEAAAGSLRKDSRMVAWSWWAGLVGVVWVGLVVVGVAWVWRRKARTSSGDRSRVCVGVWRLAAMLGMARVQGLPEDLWTVLDRRLVTLVEQAVELERGEG